MIRKCTPDDLDAVLQIWLETNIAAHSFIPESYWRGNLETVRAALPQADVYVCTDEDGIAGFIGLDGSYIAGIFVRAEKQSRGAGRQLLDHAKRIRPALTLHVYEQNARAVRFYRAAGFSVRAAGVDDATGTREYEMVWPA